MSDAPLESEPAASNILSKGTRANPDVSKELEDSDPVQNTVKGGEAKFMPGSVVPDGE